MTVPPPPRPASPRRTPRRAGPADVAAPRRAAPHDPWAVTPSDPLHGWPPPRPPSWLRAASATGVDWTITLFGPGSGVLLLLARALFDNGKAGDTAAGLVVLLCASVAGIIAVVLFFVRLFAKPFPPWIGMLLASGTGTTIWVLAGLVPLVEGGHITFSGP